MKKKIKENNLLILRALHGNYGQKYIAYKLDISQTAYGKMENGLLEPSEKIINSLSELYNYDVASLIYLDKEELRIRLIREHSSTSNISLKEKVGMNIQPAKRKFIIFVNKMKTISIW